MSPAPPASAAVLPADLLRALFDESPAALVVADAAGVVLALNALAQKRFPALAPGAPLADVPELAGAWSADAAPGTPHPGEGWTCTRRRLGPDAWLLEATPPLHPASDPALQRLADALPAVVWIVDTARRHRYLNRQWYAFTGATGTHETWWEYLHPDDAAATRTLWNEAFDAGQPFEMQYRFRRHDGAYVWHHVHALPQHDDAGALWGWIGLCTSLDPLERDPAAGRLLQALARERATSQQLAERVDAHAEAQNRLEDRYRALEARSRDLHDFAYVASHDLQEPLRKIQSYADLLRLDFGAALPGEGLRYLDRMQDAAGRMSRLVRDLLVYSRIVSQPHPPEPVDLGAVARDVVSDLDLVVRETQASVEIEPLPTLVADPTQMRQLVQNLVLNALKYRRADVPPRVRVAGRAETDASGRLLAVLTVSDNGRGFTEAQAEQIFQPFQRLVGREVEGTGFGLPIVRRIAERHGGSVTAEGRPGAGATFTVRLPAA